VLCQRRKTYHLAILDMQMPQMGSLELASRIKADPSISPQTHNAEAPWADAGTGRSAQVGIEAYLTKPVKQSQLYDIIATVMGSLENMTPNLKRKPARHPPQLKESKALKPRPHPRR